MQLLGTPLGEVVASKGADLVLRGLDTAYSEELADRLVIGMPQELEKATEGMSDRAKNIIKSLNMQLQQVQQALQAAQMDIKHGLTKTLHQEATKLQVEHLKDKRAEADTHTDAFVKLEDTHTRAHTALEVAEIREGGAIIGKHVDGKYDREAAEAAEKAAQRAEAAKPNGAA
jgi:RNase H-fold protein (predicted Holliday junction resolvase)